MWSGYSKRYLSCCITAVSEEKWLLCRLQMNILETEQLINYFGVINDFFSFFSYFLSQLHLYQYVITGKVK